jgi:hypothetical protein
VISIHDYEDALEIRAIQARRRLESFAHWRRYLSIPDPPVIDRHPDIEHRWAYLTMREETARERAIIQEAMR